MPLDDPGDGAVDEFLVADVDLGRRADAARLGDLGGRAFERLGLAPADHDGRAEGRQLVRGTAPDPGATTGDEDDLIAEQVLSEDAVECLGHGASGGSPIIAQSSPDRRPPPAKRRALPPSTLRMPSASRARQASHPDRPAARGTVPNLLGNAMTPATLGPWLARPERLSALAPTTLQEIGDCFRAVEQDVEARIVPLGGRGRSRTRLPTAC